MKKNQLARNLLPKIIAPKFKVKGFILNEYELRSLQVEVAKGNLKDKISVIDMQTKQKVYILENGILSDKLTSNALGIASKYALELMNLKNIKKII